MPTAAEKLDLISRNTEEVLTAQDAERLVMDGKPLRHYIGFEISGRIHLGTGLQCMAKVRDFQAAGIDCTLFLADWHTWINDKLGGDWPFIKAVATAYFAEGLKACLRGLGGDPDKLTLQMGSDLYQRDADNYWSTVVEISKHTNLARIQRSITILGRKEGESVDFAKLLYPVMQVADIFALQVNVAHAGLDQRKAPVIAREVGKKLHIHPLLDSAGNAIPPVAVHHHLILGLRKPPVWPVPTENRQDLWASMKMSKSEPDSAIFIDDSADDIRRKVNKAFCPPEESEFNPILDWARSLIYGAAGQTMRIADQQGATTTYDRYDELETAYMTGALHPGDLKRGMAEWLIETLNPARETLGSAELTDIRKRLETQTTGRRH